MSKGEMAVIVTISWIAGLVVPSDRMVDHIQGHPRSADKLEE